MFALVDASSGLDAASKNSSLKRSVRIYHRCFLMMLFQKALSATPSTVGTIHSVNLGFLADTLHSGPGAGFIQLAARRAAHANAAHGFSAEFDRQAAGQDQYLIVHVAQAL